MIWGPLQGKVAAIEASEVAGFAAGEAVGAAIGAVRFARKDFFKGTNYTAKVKKQMKMEDLHSFPESVKAFQDSGKWTPLRGGDDVIRPKLEIPGCYKGKKGNFEFIREPDRTISHRWFKEIKE